MAEPPISNSCTTATNEGFQLNKYMDLSLAQAVLASPNCRPNPAVGAVIVGTDGTILGMGHTQRAGQDHAEVSALRNAMSLGHDVTGATVYVTLEPCSHYGRTGPCALALIEAKIAKVVASTEDPNPEVSGRGFQMLRAAGIEVVIGPGAKRSKELNFGFFSRHIRATPWVRLKVASSIDGRTAIANGQSKWITGTKARENGHTWRSKASAILTGIGTILKDDPYLDTRNTAAIKEPLLVVIDSQMRTPPTAKVFLAERPVLIFSISKDASKRAALEAIGATIILVPEHENQPNRVDLRAVLNELTERHIDELHVEAGATLNGTFIREDLADELIWYVAPKLLGEGAPIASLGIFDSISDCPEFRFISADTVGDDLCIVARNHKSEDFLN